MSQEEKIDDQFSERKRPPDDGSPITVGGGGGKKPKDRDGVRDRENVSCRFIDDEFPEEGRPNNGRHPHRHKDNGKIKTFLIRSRGEWRDFSNLLPPNGNCQIVISCEGDNDDVIINGNKFGIDMNPDTYEDLGDGVHTNPNAASFINGVSLNDGQNLRNFGPFSEDDDCKVCTDFVAPNQSKCPSDPVITPISHDEKIDDQSLERKRPTDDGSPITVGGGGGKKPKDRDRGNVSCIFEDGKYPEEGRPNNGKHSFRHKDGKKIETFKIRRGGKWRNYSSMLPLNGDCRIEIFCSEEGDRNDVTIHGKKLGIDMNPEVYVDLGDGVHENANAASYVNNVVLNDGDLHNLGPFTADDDCAVCTDHVAPKDSKCPSDPS